MEWTRDGRSRWHFHGLGPVPLGPNVIALAAGISKDSMLSRKESIISGAGAGGRIVYMKNMRFGVITASLVLIPPIIGSIAYFAPFRDGAGFFFVNYLYIA